MDLRQFDQRFRGDAARPGISLPGARREAPADLARGRDAVEVSATIDDSDGPADVVDLLILDAFTTGRQPFARSADLDNVYPDATLMPPGARLLRDTRSSDGQHTWLASGPGWTIRCSHWTRSGSAVVTVTAVTAELADAQLAAAIAGAVKPRPQRLDSKVPIGFWHLGSRGPVRIRRDIDTQLWDDVRGNYCEQVRAAMEPVMALDGGQLRGRLMLVHGPPGTGKTSLMRTLARQWREWCQLDCVLDPERLFGDPSYLLQVALGDDDGPAWRLLLLEDCDELIRGEAKFASGQQLSRLLNLTDGLLGQGRKVLVAITTNEPLSALHPAIVRPGRALAQLEVGRLSRAEALAWLDRADGEAGDEVRQARRRAVGSQGATLAELFALLAGDAPGPTGQLGTVPGEGTGLYL